MTQEFIEWCEQIGVDPQQEWNRLQKDILRVRRAGECYAVVNRGQLWYDTLTFEQKEELKAWYRAWLDVTETLEAPSKLEWLT